MLSGVHQKFYDAARNGRVDIGLHFHGFEGKKFRPAFHRVIGLHGNAADYAGRWSGHLAGIGGIGLWMGALNDSQRPIAGSGIGAAASAPDTVMTVVVWCR